MCVYIYTVVSICKFHEYFPFAREWFANSYANLPNL